MAAQDFGEFAMSLCQFRGHNRLSRELETRTLTQSTGGGSGFICSNRAVWFVGPRLCLKWSCLLP